MPSSAPSNRYPRPHINQCVNFGTSSRSSSVINILYNGGMRSNGKLSSRNEKMMAGRLLDA